MHFVLARKRMTLGLAKHENVARIGWSSNVCRIERARSAKQSVGVRGREGRTPAKEYHVGELHRHPQKRGEEHMNKPTLVIMAAGMGSRYGGLKQIDPVDEQGDIIMDFSIYDAIQAGFEKVVFIIKKENEADFKEAIGNRLSNRIKVAYVYQDINNVPERFVVPQKRVKPWGTGHAVLCASEAVDGPFVAINADDYYGREAFELIYQYLTTHQDSDKYRYAMVGYRLDNTLTDNGYVARGVCQTDNDGYLISVTERTHIEKRDGKAEYTEDGGQTWNELDMDASVSMNMWGFTESFLVELRRRFPKFLQNAVQDNPESAEYFLPSVVSELIAEDLATVQVLKTADKWYGVTYQEDKPIVEAAVKKMKADGKYPEVLK